jgi:alkylation response protein AidB-like acyl-CoA dehydrogenase
MTAITGASTPGTVSDRVQEVSSLVRDRDDEIERARRLPDDIVDGLRRTRLFSMLVEESFGGLGLDLPAAVRIVEDLAALSASVAWVLAVGAGAAYWTTALVADDIAAKIHPRAEPSIITSTPGPEGRAVKEPDGWRVTGRWSFASGSAHSDWVAVGCRLADGDGPLVGADGIPRFCSFLIPADQVRTKDTWHVTGLRATASNDLVIGADDDIVVHESMSYNHLRDPQRRPGQRYAYTGLAHALIPAVMVGIARGAVQDALAICAAKKDRYGGPSMALNPFVQFNLGQAVAKADAAACLLHAAVDEAWTAAAQGRPNDRVRARVRAACTFAVDAGGEATAFARSAVGSSGIYENCPLERRCRDAATAATHIAHRASSYADAGALLLGTYASPMGIF